MSRKIEDGKTPQQRYEEKTIIAAAFKLNRKTDADIIQWLDTHDGGNRQGYIKALIRAEIARNS